jgi:predicted nucleic acid-binding protein
VIAYIDSSVLVRSYLVDEAGHDDAVALLDRSDIGLVTGSWSRIEVSGALIRAARGRRVDGTRLVDLLDQDLGPDGRVVVIAGDQGDVELQALSLVLAHGIRAMDAWHLATAGLVIPTLLEPGEVIGFATRDDEQGNVAGLLGFERI